MTRIEGLLDNPDNATLGEWFEAFHDELKVSINESITRQGAIDMMAQHILTQPVFEALFERYEFARNNPVAQALDALRKDFGGVRPGERNPRPGTLLRKRAAARPRPGQQRGAPACVDGAVREVLQATAHEEGGGSARNRLHAESRVVDFIIAERKPRVLEHEFGRSPE